MSDTYPMPKGGWVCYHCGEHFRTKGSARDHFGGDPGATAACQIKAGDERGLVMALRKAEGDVAFWKERALKDESEIEMLEKLNCPNCGHRKHEGVSCLVSDCCDCGA